MNPSYTHYKPSGLGEVGYRWVLYDNEMPDEVLRGLMGDPGRNASVNERATISSHVRNAYRGTLPNGRVSARDFREWEKKNAEPLRAKE